MRRRVPSALVIVLSWLGAAPAGADDRPYVWAIDPDGPRDTEVEAVYQLTTAAGTSGAVRYLSAGSPGVLQQLGAEAALAPWVTIGAYGLASLGAPVDEPVNATGGGYAQFTLVRPEPGESGGTFAVMISGLRELPTTEHDDVLALSVWALGGYEHRPVYVAGNLQIERRFVSDADPVDVMARLGVMTELTGGLRLGPEYIGQDLEDYLEPEEAEGGAAHLVALSLALHLATSGVNLGISPGVVFARGEVGFGGAFDASVRFYAW